MNKDKFERAIALGNFCYWAATTSKPSSTCPDIVVDAAKALLQEVRRSVSEGCQYKTADFAMKLFKLQDYYESCIDDDVMEFLKHFFNAPQDCTIETIRDSIHAYEARQPT